MPVRQELPRGAPALPLLILQTEDGATAAGWGDAVRAVVSDAAGSATLLAPSVEPVAGVRVYSLAAAGLPVKAPVHFAAEGTTFVVGLDRKLVAAAVKTQRGAANASAAGWLSLGGGVRALAAGPVKYDKEGPVLIVEDGTPFIGRQQRNGNGEPVPDPELVKQAAKARDEFLKAPRRPAAGFGDARRAAAGLHVEGSLPNVQGGLAGPIDKALAWLDRATAAVPGRDGENGVLFQK